MSGDRKELSFAIAGSMCTPWSSAGKKEGLTSKHTESYYLWAHETKHNGYDVITLENSPNFPQEIFEAILGEGYAVYVGVFGPEDLGWPVRRRRKLMTAIKKDKLAWAGPSSDALMATFAGIFFKAQQSSGDVFLKAQDPSEELDVRRRLACVRGYNVSREEVEKMPFKALLTPFQRADVSKYIQAYEDSRKNQGRGMDSAFIVDLSQKYERKRMSRRAVPTLMKNTHLFSFSADRFFTAADIEASQGMPRHGSAAWVQYASCVAADTTALPDAIRLCLAGNGMHLTAIAAWHIFVFANVVRRERGICRPPSTASEMRKRSRLARGGTFLYEEQGLSQARTFDYESGEVESE